MNILFMTLGRMENINDHSIYCDLLRVFRSKGHKLYTISPYERRTGKSTTYQTVDGIHMLHIQTGNVTGSANLIEKGIATLSIESLFIAGIKKYFSDVKFDLVMYSTPPITFCNAISFLRKRDGARTYLLLKDIFPQNAVDMGMMSKSGVKGILYRVFRSKEKKLYAISDYIGCMSQANVDFIVKHNPEIDRKKIEISPNCIEVADKSICEADRIAIRKKYDIPLDKTVFVYGGNLGKPQGIPFFMECLKGQADNKEAFFLVVGNGSEYGKLAEDAQKSEQSNFRLMKSLPKADYETLVAACDVGMVFLDHRFTIPNFPSRLLSYMQAKLPILAATDPNTDVGTIIAEGGFGWWCESNDSAAFAQTIEQCLSSDLKAMGQKGYEYLRENYTVERQYEIIMKHFQ